MTLAAPLQEAREVSPAEVRRWQMVTAHLQTTHRLRRRLGERPDWLVGDDEAVLEPNGRLAHASGEAKERDVQAMLREAAVRVDKARTQKAGRGDEALEAWTAMMHGRWSLVDRFDTDGRRYIIAYRNPAHVRDPRGLSKREAEVAVYAAQGFSNKLIAYHLGVGESTISTHMTALIRKLGLKSRAELVRDFHPASE